jgi:hypothetical protein
MEEGRRRNPAMSQIQAPSVGAWFRWEKVSSSDVRRETNDSFPFDDLQRLRATSTDPTELEMFEDCTVVQQWQGA